LPRKLGNTESHRKYLKSLNIWITSPPSRNSLNPLFLRLSDRIYRIYRICFFFESLNLWTDPDCYRESSAKLIFESLIFWILEFFATKTQKNWKPQNTFLNLWIFDFLNFWILEFLNPWTDPDCYRESSAKLILELKCRRDCASVAKSDFRQSGQPEFI
jgi:hypothetical protein